MHWANLHQAGSTATTTLRPYVPVPQENVELSGGEGDRECHNTGVSGADIHTHAHTASIVLNLLVSLFGWLMVTDRHTHRIVTLAVHAR